MSRAKILIVEDDHDLRDGLTITLRAKDYETVVADDALSALTAIKEQRPDVVLLDIGLPLGNGFTVLDYLRRSPADSAVPVLVMTGRDPYSRDRELSLSMGAKAFLQKPVDNADLLREISKALEEKKRA